MVLNVSIHIVIWCRKVGEVEVETSDMICLCVIGVVVVVCIIGLIVTTFKEKKMKTKPAYYSAVGEWLHGKR